MADYGLLSGLAQGVNAGLDAYNSAQDRQLRIKQYQDELEVKGLLRKQQADLAKRKEALDLYKSGAKYGEGGQLEPDLENPNYAAQESRQRYQDALSASVFGKEAVENAKLAQQMSLKEKELEQERLLKQQQIDIDKSYKEGLLKNKAKSGKNGAGGAKMLPAGMVESQSAAKYINDTVLTDLASTLKQNEAILGPAQGLMGKGLGFLGVGDRAEKQRVIQSNIDAGVQEIGKFLEGGKLAEGDLARYREMAPKVTDPPNVAQQKLQLLSKLVAEKQRASLEALRASGYDVGGIQQSTAIKKSGESDREAKLRRLKELEGK